MDTNIDQQKMLGLDVKADIEYLVSHLQIRADVTAGVLQSTKEEIDEIATRAGSIRMPRRRSSWPRSKSKETRLPKANA